MEVYYNGKWGTVCDDGWDDTDAGVVCRQLGFGSSGAAIGSAGFGQGSGSIWLDSVTCTGNESALASCGHPGVGITSGCYRYENAGVKCVEGNSCESIISYNAAIMELMHGFIISSKIAKTVLSEITQLANSYQLGVMT